jgi:Family of unknown function (DUF6412)
MGVLVSLVTVLAVLTDLSGGPTASLAVLATVAALAAVTAVLLAVATRAARPPRLSWSALRSATRQRSEQTIFLRLRDPDAAGRPQPRAPAVQPTAG